MYLPRSIANQVHVATTIPPALTMLQKKAAAPPPACDHCASAVVPYPQAADPLLAAVPRDSDSVCQRRPWCRGMLAAGALQHGAGAGIPALPVNSLHTLQILMRLLLWIMRRHELSDSDVDAPVQEPVLCLRCAAS